MAKALHRKEGGFLPAGAEALLRRWAVQGAGVLLIALGLALTFGLGSYEPRDPSLNTAAQAPIANMTGTVGALAADLLLQTIGPAAWLLALALLVWGGRMLVTLRAPRLLWLRATLLLCALPLLAGGLAMLALPGWLHPPAALGGELASLGGALGTMIVNGLRLLARATHIAPYAPLLVLAASLIGLALLVYALGLTWREWAGLGRWALIPPRLALAGLRKLRARRATIVERREPVLGDAAPAEEELAPAAVALDSAPADEEAEAEPLVAPRSARAAPSKRERESRQKSLDFKGGAAFQPPPIDLLAEPPPSRIAAINEDALEQNARLLETVLDDFGVQGRISKVRPGPVVTLYELEPAPGTKTSRVIGLADDISRQMSALSVRIATVPGRSVIGIELPNAKRETVFLRELLAADSFERTPAPLTLVLGKDIGGQPVMVDLARMPHLLIAGTTGSGKSVAINTMILSLLYRLTPEHCRLVLIDPKMLELSVYDGIPHLLTPVVTEPGRAVAALKWTVREMEDRYRAMSQLGVRNITGYNQRLAEARAKGERLTRTVQTGFDPETGRPMYEEQELALKPLPFIVVVVDEMADLMLVAGKDIEAAVQRLAQMARAAGIHLVMATQRPSVDVITGTIKANFPTRVSFQVTSKIDSRTILGEQGAEQLLGQGDMLYMAAGGRITRVHGPFVSDREVEAVAKHLRAQGEPAYVEGVADEVEAEDALPGAADFSDELYDQAVALVARERKASTSFIQRHLQIGYNRAARIIEKMEAEGVVSRANHMGKREVLVQSHEG